MKVQIPDQLKADIPPTNWGKMLSATPVVMAVVATMLAGLASSEMTRAQYDRALAAQQQSKAGDQWSFFQAKRLRGALQQNALDLLQSTVELHPLNAAALKDAAEQLPAQPDQAEATKVRAEMLAVLDSPAGQQALNFLQRGEVPPAGAAPVLDPNVKAALDAVENLTPDPELVPLLARVGLKTLDEALRAARDRAQAFDNTSKPVNQTIDQLESLLARQAASVQAKPASMAFAASLTRDFTAARLRYASLRYEVEARLNQAIANFYELQVRKSNISAERHHNRSQRFFFGMLAAQLGVIVSTLAMAARQRNLLWSIAAAAGLVAIAFAVYVYLYVQAFGRQMRIIIDERCTGYSHPGHPERPERIITTLARLRGQSELPITWSKPGPGDDAAILRAHTLEHLARLSVPEDFDDDTPAFPDLADYARASVGAALDGLKAARAGETVFSLMRPPGHHATRNRAMGFCYLNNIAIAALEALATGAKRVAVLDFDVHHGNGTESILLNNPGAAFFSIHQFPCYPGTGTRNLGNNCYNYPVLPQTLRGEYRHVLASALEHLRKFKPRLVAVSAGFDAYARDPLAQGALEAEDFYWLGQSLRNLGVPLFSLLEGGYSADLPELILAYLKGLEGK